MEDSGGSASCIVRIEGSKILWGKPSLGLIYFVFFVPSWLMVRVSRTIREVSRFLVVLIAQ